MNIIICGGGVIGTCAAYYLKHRGADVTVIERAGVANGASGKSGGFLGRDTRVKWERDLFGTQSRFLAIFLFLELQVF